MENSEFNTVPKRILIHHPDTYKALENVTDATLQQYNYLAVPDVHGLYRQYNNLITTINQLGVETIELTDAITQEELQDVDVRNPNLMFMRDSAITLPWAPRKYIPARLALPSRQTETIAASRALTNLGLSPLVAFEYDEFLEGGDVMPIVHEDKRTLVIGFGTRTTQSAALKLAHTLMPEYIDQIIGLRHDPNVLHLDTGFTILPNKTILAARGMFNSGFVIDAEKKISEVDPMAFVEALGFNVIRTTKEDAIRYERCNMLPLGNSMYVSFTLPPELKSQLENQAGINIQEVPGDEIAKATGGVHCLTRPIYL